MKKRAHAENAEEEKLTYRHSCTYLEHSLAIMIAPFSLDLLSAPNIIQIPVSYVVSGLSMQEDVDIVLLNSTIISNIH